MRSCLKTSKQTKPAEARHGGTHLESQKWEEEAGDLQEFKASMVYTGSSRIGRITQWHPEDREEGKIVPLSSLLFLRVRFTILIIVSEVVYSELDPSLHPYLLYPPCCSPESSHPSPSVFTTDPLTPFSHCLNSQSRSQLPENTSLVSMTSPQTTGISEHPALSIQGPVTVTLMWLFLYLPIWCLPLSPPPPK